MKLKSNCETEGERDTPLAGELSLLHNEDKEVRPQPAPEPTVEAQQGAGIEELSEEIQKVTKGEVQEAKVGKERKKKEFEAGTGEVKRKEEQIMGETKSAQGGGRL